MTKAKVGSAADRGSATLEVVVLAPALLLLLGLVVTAGRLVVAEGAIEEAARDGARQASTARGASAAASIARTAAEGTLAAQGLRCASSGVSVDTSGFSVPVGQPAQVTATVTCTVQLSDVAVPGTPGSKTLRASFSSPIDRYRERQ